MGNKKRKFCTLEEVLARPWCYYCERDFDDLRVLVEHQKAKHFQCHVGTCHRRLNTAGGLRVHMAQVHKEELREVPNSLDHRKELNIEIFGLEGIPQPLVDARRAVLIKEYSRIETDHVTKTGNPLPGSTAAKERTNESGSSKRVKIDSTEDIKKRLAEAKAKRDAIKAAKAAGLPPPDSSTPPAAKTTANGQDTQMQDVPTYSAPPAPEASFMPIPPTYASSSPPVPMGLPNAPFQPPPAAPGTNFNNSAISPPPVGSVHYANMIPHHRFNPNMPPAYTMPQPYPMASMSPDSVPEPRLARDSVPEPVPEPRLARDSVPEPRLASSALPTTSLAPGTKPVLPEHLTSRLNDISGDSDPRGPADMEIGPSADFIGKTPEDIKAKIDAKIQEEWDNCVDKKAQGYEYDSETQTLLKPGTTAREAAATPEERAAAKEARVKASAERDERHKREPGLVVEFRELKISDNRVTPEEKRARAGRYQPKSKSTTMPTWMATQGATGAVDLQIS